MKLSAILTHVTDRLSANAFLGDLEIIANIDKDHNKRLETALKDMGLVIVVMQSSGAAPKANAPRLILENEIVISVLENPTRNETGKGAIEVAEIILETLHQAEWASERGLRNVMQVDTPAYEAGPLDSGLIIYFCNFVVKSNQV